MKLAGKLLLGIAVAAVVVMGAEMWHETQRMNELATLELEHETRIARALQASITLIWERQTEVIARQVVEQINVGTPNVDIHWVALAARSPGGGPRLAEDIRRAYAQGKFVQFTQADAQGVMQRYTYVPIANAGEPLAALELVQSMEPHHRFMRRTQMYQGAATLGMILVSGTLAIIIGVWFVDRPVRQLRAHVRALGDGTPPPPIAVRQRDEIGALAEELNTMSERLASRERLQHADRLRTVGQLASGIAHELGTPLNVIALRARLISSGEATGTDAATNAQVIVDQAGRMTTIIRQVLDYSRRQGVKMVVVDVRQVVTRTLDLIDTFARKQGVTVEVQAHDRPLPVRASETQLQQVLTNILLNGVQAMPAGGGKLSVEVGTCAAAPPAGHGGPRGDYCCVVVTDEGAGIAADDLPHIFEPFYTTKGVGEGTGLGLAVAHAIVEEHGGWITAENAPGRGARFAIYLLPTQEGEVAA